MHDFPHPHEAVAAGLRIIGIEGDGDGLVGRQLRALAQDAHGRAFFPNHLVRPQGAIRGALPILGDDFQQLRRSDGDGDQRVFVGQDLPCIGDGDRPGGDFGSAEGAVEDGIDRGLVAAQGFGKTLAEKLGERAFAVFSGDGCLERCEDAGELFLGRFQLGLGKVDHAGIEVDALVHVCRCRRLCDQLAAVHIEGEVDLAAVDSVVVRLGVERAADFQRGHVRMGVPGDEYVRTRCLREGVADRVCEIIFLQMPVVAEHDDGIRLGGTRLGDGLFQGERRIGRGDAAEGFRHQPEGEPRCHKADECDPETRDFPHSPRDHLFGSTC